MLPDKNIFKTMPRKSVFYYTIETYGDGDKGVTIYRIVNNKPKSVADFDVAWGNSCEEAVENYIKHNNLSKNFYCERL